MSVCIIKTIPFTFCVYLVSNGPLSHSFSPVSGLTILNERTAQCQSALGKLQRGRKAKPSMRLSTCLIHTKERALKHKSLLVSITIPSCPSCHGDKMHPVIWIGRSCFSSSGHSFKKVLADGFVS